MSEPTSSSARPVPPLYRVDDEVAATLAGHRPVLLNLLDGFVDAGQVTRAVTEAVLAGCEHTPLAVFDHDQFHDYRSRRPLITFDTNRFTDLTEIAVVLHKVTDAHGESFLLLDGPEPDARWGAVLAAIEELVQRFEVRLTVTAHGVPMAVPHTRPVSMTVHGTDEALIEGHRSWIDRVEIPASFASVLEYRLGQQGRSAHGFAVHVPHYIAQSRFAPAALAVLGEIEKITGLSIPADELQAAAAATMAEITAETNQSEDVQRVVGELEAQYDGYVERASQELPSADEIGAEFERFLRDQSGFDDEDGPGRPI